MSAPSWIVSGSSRPRVSGRNSASKPLSNVQYQTYYVFYKDEKGGVDTIIKVKIAYAVKARTPYMMRGSGVQVSLEKKKSSVSDGVLGMAIRMRKML